MSQDKCASTGENSGACPGSKIPIEPAGTSCQTCLLQCNSSGSETTNCASSGSVSVSPSTVCNMVGPDAWYKVGAEKSRSEEHTSELQSRFDLVCRLLLEK